MRALMILTALGLCAAPLEGATSPLPQGCEGIVTIQHRGCRVVNLWHCDGDPAGHQHLSLIGSEGVIRTRTVDAQYQWLATSYPQTGRQEWMRPDPTDAPSITELSETGQDTYQFYVDNTDNLPILNRGQDRLAGGSIELNGFELLRTSYINEYFSADGAPLGVSRGDQYVIPELRIFVWGVFYDHPNEGDVSDFSPVEILRPGDLGFFADQPKYDCGDLLSRSGVGQSDDQHPIETGFSQ